MGSALELNEHNFHEVTVDSRRLLFHIPSSSLFEADSASSAVIEELRRGGSDNEAELGRRLAGRLDGPALSGVLCDLQSLDIVTRNGAGTAAVFPTVGALPLTTVVLNVNTGCNLSCTYCYKEDLATPSAGEKMGLDTAIASIEMLLKQSPDQALYNIVFFGVSPCPTSA